VNQQAAAFERLHALTRKGYRAELGAADDSGTIRLSHLGKAHDLILHADGRVEPLEARIPRHKRKVQLPAVIPAEADADQLKFMRYLDNVSRPSLRDRTRPWRKKYVYVPAGLFVFWGICLSFTLILHGG